MKKLKNALHNKSKRVTISTPGSNENKLRFGAKIKAINSSEIDLNYDLYEKQSVSSHNSQTLTIQEKIHHQLFKIEVMERYQNKCAEVLYFLEALYI